MKHTTRLTLLFFAAHVAACSNQPSTPYPDGEEPSALRGRENPPRIGAQIDRAGRAAISTALIATFSNDAPSKGELKNDYNRAAREDWASFEDEMASNLAILDGLDTVCGNQLLATEDDPNGRYAALASVLADDRLYVRTTSGGCTAYLGLEAEIVGAIDPDTGGCGGRTLEVDVIDRSYSVLAAGILDGVGDGVDSDDVTHSDDFPFLAAPTP